MLTSAAISFCSFITRCQRASFTFGANLVLHLRAARAFLLRIAENAEPLEFRFADELAEFVDVRLGFAGKADDERRAHRDAGNAGADALDQIADVVADDVSRCISPSMWSLMCCSGMSM